MVKIPQSRRVALLIDADNAQLHHTAQVLDFSKSYGSLTICHAYSDWKKPPLSSWREKILALNVKTVQQDRIEKEATDHRIFIEVCEFLRDDAADIYVLVSSDGHFTLLCEHIQKKGKQVIVIASKNHTSQSLLNSRVKLIYVEELESEINKRNISHPTSALSTLKELEKLLDRAFLELPQKDGWVHYGLLGKKLRQLEPNFQSRFGGKKLSTWLKSLAQCFESREQFVRRINR